MVFDRTLCGFEQVIVFELQGEESGDDGGPGVLRISKIHNSAVCGTL